ncbi:hypothetical protein CDAR_54891 [Caerostris darwini]|uniref:Uncharacterized protein n=1 Tax=Caerostris darwini TaxID=1538125 RepID=A0AAV4NH15_9ARAC|nr:hypothetical protein CDAR_54891 [Caerostris darwini]
MNHCHTSASSSSSPQSSLLHPIGNEYSFSSSMPKNQRNQSEAAPHLPSTHGQSICIYEERTPQFLTREVKNRPPSASVSPTPLGFPGAWKGPKRTDGNGWGGQSTMSLQFPSHRERKESSSLFCVQSMRGRLEAANVPSRREIRGRTKGSYSDIHHSAQLIAFCELEI